MMKYDFDQVVNRRGTGSLKWDVPERELPMWVADMDFQVAPEIREALNKRVEHGVFGYSILPDAWYNAYQSWWSRKHHWEIEKDWLIFSTGVVPTLSSVVRKLTTVGENVLIQTPVYNIFFNSIRNNGRNVLESPLKYDGREYSMDFEDLERKLSHPQTTLMILCNPQNPVGKIWDKETLARVGELCAKHHVVVVSDEIHCDLTDPGTEYVPFASVSEVCRENSVTCIAPTKAFNIAGLSTSYLIIPDNKRKEQFDLRVKRDCLSSPTIFGVAACIEAYNTGDKFIEEQNKHILDNYNFLKDYLNKEAPYIKVTKLEATYLVWLDMSSLNKTNDEIGELLDQAHITCSSGSGFCKDYGSFIRVNIACPKQQLKEGLERFVGVLNEIR